MNIHGRGRTGVMHHPHCHLYAVLREVPLRDGERRLGSYGKTHKVLRRQSEDTESDQKQELKEGN